MPDTSQPPRVRQSHEITDPRPVRRAVAEYLEAQEGKQWTRSNTEHVVQLAAQFDEQIVKLMMAAGVEVEQTSVDLKKAAHAK